MIVNSFMMIKFILWLFTFCLVTTVMGQKANYKQAERFLNLGSLVGTTSIIPNALINFGTSTRLGTGCIII